MFKEISAPPKEQLLKGIGQFEDACRIESYRMTSKQAAHIDVLMFGTNFIAAGCNNERRRVHNCYHIEALTAVSDLSFDLIG